MQDQHEAPSAARSRRSVTSCASGDRVVDDGDPGPTALLDGGAHASPVQRARPLASFSPRHTETERRAIQGTTPIDPELGGGFDRLLVTPAGREGLDQGRRGESLRAQATGGEQPQVQGLLAGVGHLGEDLMPGSVGEQDLLPVPIRATLAA